MRNFFGMKKLVVLFMAVTFMATLSSPVFAAGKMKTLEVQVWPEYDQPSVLIMYAAQGITGAKKATIYFPKGTQVGTVRNKVSNNDKDSEKFTSKEKADLLETTFAIPNSQYFAEGYWDVLSGQGDQKSFNFNLKLPMDVDSVNVYIQHPATASDFTVNPKSQATQQDPQTKLSVDGYQFQNKKAGEVIPFKVSYTKKDATLSASQVNGQASQTSAKTSSSSGDADVVTIMLVILGLVFFVVGGFAFYNYKQNQSGSSVKKPSKTNRNRVSYSKVNFCPNCGSKADGKFCAKCGERLK